MGESCESGVCVCVHASQNCNVHFNKLYLYVQFLCDFLVNYDIVMRRVELSNKVTLLFLKSKNTTMRKQKEKERSSSRFLDACMYGSIRHTDFHHAILKTSHYQSLR